MDSKVNNIVIVGGGSSGWMSAALLCKMYKGTINITLVESDAIGTIGVGEATIPPLKIFNDVLGINEQDFIEKTKASIKLGIEFENWGKQGDAYMHAFGSIGKDIGYSAFHHYWLANKPQSPASLWDFSYNYQVAKQNKFSVQPKIHNDQLAGITHAYHFDAGLYANYLQQYCQQLGIRHIQGLVETINQKDNGDIESLTLQDGQVINGDLFIDCSGLHALLIDKTLNVEFESYQQWLVCDSAWAVPSEKTSPIIPYTRATAHDFGWQWRIPLQHRTGNGMVFSSKYISDEKAKQTLLDNLDAKAIGEPKLIRFKPGRRVKQWQNNCVAIGLSSGFLEPLESTSLHLVQTAIIRLTKLMPHLSITPELVAEYNRQSQTEFEQIRDFIILHYHLNQRQQGELWQYCQTMSIPDTLQHKISLFAQTANLFRQQDELFTQEAWLQVMIGQNLMPQDHNPLANILSQQERKDFLDNLKQIYQHYSAELPAHETFLNL
ncbi:tryptophan 7-halogenase [Shewanella maritima]|uniref:Tryptophan 7-halogenase n=1 Tax=Shewanella maritima TaxID=2520507 RepID=A0A411PCZ8_9GAMM|nr:tryptophan halogenase family protein [Shewanella maritima]QBF81426.1 tryptophan 7-halogenase [Shewanella maritima]